MASPDLVGISRPERAFDGLGPARKIERCAARSRCATCARIPDMGVTAIQAEFKLYGIIKRKGGWHVARCPLLDLTTQGRSAEEAQRNLREATDLFLTSCLERGTLDRAMRELGITRRERE